MNEYQDQESEPVPQPGLVDGERVRQRVLGQVAGRRRRKLRRAVIAAVAAAACLGLVAWTWGERIYQMASGGHLIDPLSPGPGHQAQAGRRGHGRDHGPAELPSSPSGHLSQHPLAHPLPIHQSRLGDRLTLLILILVHQA